MLIRRKSIDEVVQQISLAISEKKEFEIDFDAIQRGHLSTVRKFVSESFKSLEHFDLFAQLYIDDLKRSNSFQIEMCNEIRRIRKNIKASNEYLFSQAAIRIEKKINESCEAARAEIKKSVKFARIALTRKCNNFYQGANQ